MAFNFKFTSIFNQMIRDVGASEIHWKSASVLSSEERKLIESSEGLDLTPEDLKKYICENGMIAIDGRPAVLWIKKTDNTVHDLKTDPLKPNIKRFHFFADCQTMNRMRREGKYDKYCVSFRQDAKFNVFGIESGFKKRFNNLFKGNLRSQVELKDIELGVCIHCLRKANFNYINDKYPQGRKKFPLDEQRRYRIDFNLKEYFKEHGQPDFLRPKHTDSTYPNPKVEYGHEFKIAKIKYRKARGNRGYVCEKCKVDLSQMKNRGLHHIHHKSTLSTDHDFSNLQGLCLVCHTDEHKGKKIGTDEQYRKCREERRKQGIE